MTTFVTGSTGFVGSHLVKDLVFSGEKVIGLYRDIVPSRWLNEALHGCILVQGSLENFNLLQRIMSEYEVNHVFHLAGQTKVKSAFKNPINVYESNVMGTVNVLEAARSTNVEKVLVITTDKVFGEKLNAGENDPVQASEPYGTSKAAAALICDSYHKTYGLNVIRVQSCNIYGLDLHSNRIIPNTVKATLQGVSPIIFKGEQQSVRQYIYVCDVLEAMERLITGYKYGSFNICTEPLLNQADVVLEILKHFPRLQPKYVDRKGPLEIQQQSMVLTDFGWKPKYNFEEGIKLTIQRFKEYWLCGS